VLGGHGWKLRLLGHDICPVRLPLSTLIDPLLDDVSLLGGELPARTGRRHHLVWLSRCDPLEKLALSGFAWNECLLPLGRIEPQAALAFCLVRAVALEARIRQDRSHIAIEIDTFRTRHGEGKHHEKKERDSLHGRVLLAVGYIQYTG